LSKILILIPSLGSFNTFLSEQVEELLRNKWEVILVSSRGNKEIGIANVKFIGLDLPRGMQPFSYFTSSLKLKRVITENKPDLIHAHFSAAAILLMLAKDKNTPLCYATIQGVVYTASSGVKAWFYRIVETIAFKRLDKVWVLTKDDKYQLENDGVKVYCQRSMGFGCRLDLFDSNLFNQEEIRLLKNKLDILPDDFVIIYVGRLVDFKGINIVYRAFKKITAGRTNVKLLILGNIDSLHPTGLTVAEMEDMKTHSAIRMVGHVKEVAAYLAIADLNVFPSLREGMPVNLMESLAMGVPVITNNCRGCRDVVSDKISGVLLTERTPDAYAREILYLIDHPELLRKMKSNALLKRNDFDRQFFIKETLESYSCTKQ